MQFRVAQIWIDYEFLKKILFTTTNFERVFQTLKLTSFDVINLLLLTI